MTAVAGTRARVAGMTDPATPRRTARPASRHRSHTGCLPRDADVPRGTRAHRARSRSRINGGVRPGPAGPARARAAPSRAPSRDHDQARARSERRRARDERHGAPDRRLHVGADRGRLRHLPRPRHRSRPDPHDRAPRHHVSTAWAARSASCSRARTRTHAARPRSAGCATSTRACRASGPTAS